MSTVKQILHRKTSTDSYDTIYLQSSADMIKTSDNSNVQAVLNTHGNDIDDLKTSVSSGKALVAAAVTDKGVPTAANATFATIAGNVRSISGEAYAYICASYINGHTCTCSGNGKTLTAPTNTGYWVFGVDGPGTYTLTDVEYNISSTVNVTARYQAIRNTIVPQFVADLKTASIGNSIIIDGYEWLVVHKTYLADTPTTATLGLRYWYIDTVFGPTRDYAGSTIANLCATFGSNTLSATTRNFLNNVTVNGVTAKVFIPSYEQMNGGFSHYNSNNNRIFRNSSGTAKYWFTSSPSDIDYRVWVVQTDGTLFNLRGSGFTPYTNSMGFRPHMEVNIDF